MAARLASVTEAELDLAAGYAWYENRRPGLGEEFLSSVDAWLEGIRRHPEMHALVHETYRRALIRRFPFAIFYEYTGAAVTVSHLPRPGKMAPVPPLIRRDGLCHVLHAGNSKQSWLVASLKIGILQETGTRHAISASLATSDRACFCGPS